MKMYYCLIEQKPISPVGIYGMNILECEEVEVDVQGITPKYNHIIERFSFRMQTEMRLITMLIYKPGPDIKKLIEE